MGTPADLTSCDDLYVMPHADPTWATHKNLINFNTNNDGFIWAGCHAVSVMENLYDPATGNPTPVMDFLSLTGLVPFGSHSNGSPPYTYTAPVSGANQGGDPINQYLGKIDTATTNGSEEIYLPKPGGGWRPTTKVLAWDPTDTDVPSKSPGPASVLAYGRGFGNSNNGLVMEEAGHSLAGNGVDNIAAQRAFFNFQLLAGIEHSPRATVTAPSSVEPGQTVPVSGVPSGGSGTYTLKWESDCGGSFANPTAASTTFTAPTGITSPTACNIKLVVTDSCGRVAFGFATTTVQPPADLSLTKALTAPGNRLVAGANATYVLTVKNLGPGNATGVVTTDPLPTGLTLVSATPSIGTCSVQGQTSTSQLTPPPATMAVGATATITLVVAVSSSFTGSATNSASVTADQRDPVPGNNTATLTTPVIHPAIALAKSANPPAIKSGQSVTYTYTATNPGDDPLSSVAVTDNKCSPVTLTGGDANSNGKLDPGETWTFTCTTTLSVDTTNTATVTGKDSNGNNQTAQAQATVPVIAPALSITKSPATETVASGGTAVFVITVTNTGNTVLTNVVVTDPSTPSCAQTIATLAAGGSIQFQCSLANVTAGFTNTVNATAKDPGGQIVTALPSSSVVSIGSNDLNVTKTANPTTARPGDFIDYTIVVKNTGTTTQTNLTLTDPAPANTSWVSTQVTSPGVNKTASDSFPNTACNGGGDVSGYSGGTGWSGIWTEVNQVDGCHDGDVAVEVDNAIAGSTNALRVSAGNNNASQTHWIYRMVDLSGTTSGTVSFDWARNNVGGDATHQRTVTIDVSTDGTTWTNIGTVAGLTTGNVNDTAYMHATFNIPAALLSATTRIRFFPGPNNGGGDKFYFDNIVVTASSPAISNAGGPMPNLLSAGGPYNLLPGQSLTVVVRVQVSASTPSSVTNIANGARAASDQSQGQAGANVALIVPHMSVVKHVSANGSPPSSSVTVEKGTTVTYTFDVTNDGSDVLSGVAVADNPTCSGMALTGGDTNANGKLDPGEVWHYSCTAVPAASGPDTVTVNANDSKGSAVTPASATANVTVINPQIAVTVTPSATTVRPGTPVTLTYTVTNPGDTPLAAPSLSDPACPAGSLQGPTITTGNADALLDPGEVWTYTCTITPTSAVTSTPTASGTDKLGKTVTATASTTVNVISPAMKVTKTASATNI
jgi:uncharacterized repeat protein (TIGR01451 family)